MQALGETVLLANEIIYIPILTKFVTTVTIPSSVILRLSCSRYSRGYIVLG